MGVIFAAIVCFVWKIMGFSLERVDFQQKTVEKCVWISVFHRAFPQAFDNADEGICACFHTISGVCTEKSDSLRENEVFHRWMLKTGGMIG